METNREACIRALNEALETTHQMAKEHRQKIKDSRYKSPRALELAAKQIADNLQGLKNMWHLLDMGNQIIHEPRDA
ncbi:MAG: hypothetical protein O7B35_12565 [Deltaproteobacteria bacterium]|nr:hypothetical protein [Deltaproteobacteria bacterium]